MAFFSKFKRDLASYLLWIGLIYLFSHSGLCKDLESKVAYPLYFKTRDILNLSPSLHPSIRIIAFDDSSLNKTKTPDLKSETWINLLRKLDKRKPRAILIDKIFAVHTTKNQGDEEKEQKLSDFGNIKSKIYTGAFLKNANLGSSNQIPINFAAKRLENLIRDPRNQNTDIQKIKDNLKLKTIDPAYIFGPAKQYQPYFKKFGHIHFQGNSAFYPVFRLGNDYAINHLSTAIEEKPILFKNDLYLNGSKVPLTSDGSAIINFLPTKNLFKQIIPMHLFLGTGKDAEMVLRVINKGNIVLILPNFFTGSTDFHQTPIGSVPGGLIIASGLNMMLQKSWIHVVEHNLIIIVIFSLTGVLVSVLLKKLNLIFLTFCLSLTWTLISISTFSLFNIILPYFLSLVSIYLGIFIVFSKRYELLKQILSTRNG